SAAMSSRSPASTQITCKLDTLKGKRMISTGTLRRSQIASRLGESRLEALLESAELLHASLQPEDLLRHLLRTVMGRLLVSRAAVAIRKDCAMQVALARGVPSIAAGDILTEETARVA